MAKRKTRRTAPAKKTATVKKTSTVKKTVPVAAPVVEAVVEVPYVYTPDAFERRVIAAGTFLENAIRYTFSLVRA